MADKEKKTRNLASHLWTAASVAALTMVTTGGLAMADDNANGTTSQSTTAPTALQTTKSSDSSTATTPDSNNSSNSTAVSQNGTQTVQNSANQNFNNQLNAYAQNFLHQAISEGAQVDPNNLTANQIYALNQLQKYTTAPAKATSTRYTYKQFADDAQKVSEVDSQYAIPYFKAANIQNLPAARAKDGQTGQVADMDIWDSWPVQDPTTGHVLNWHGKQLVFAMMGTPGANSNHVYLLYNDYNSNNLNGWRNAGDVFAGYRGDKKTGLEIPDDQEWSGSAYILPDNTVQLFYTHSKYERKTATPQNHQRIATANIVLRENADGTISIVQVRNDHTLFKGDSSAKNKAGYRYQTFQQWAHNATKFDGKIEDFGGADNFSMRDPHIVKDAQGNRYLVFEASTGDEDYQNEDQIYDLRNYGGNAKFQLESLFNLIDNNYSITDKNTGKQIKLGRDMRIRASQANAAIGIVKLGGSENNPTVDSVLDPLVTALMVSDEIERPDIVKIGDTYYLFAASRLNRGTNDAAWRKDNDVVGDNVVMLGWYSKDLTKGYQPLNGNALVLTSTVPANWRTATYSYYAVPVEGSKANNTILITDYMTNRSHVADLVDKDGKAVLDDKMVATNPHNSTWGPSFLVQINPDGTTKVLNIVTGQGVWHYDDSTPDEAATFLTGSAKAAALPWEIGVPFDNGSILASNNNLIDNVPQPYNPTTPGQPSQPSQPTTPGQPSQPTTPGQPSQPTTPGQPSQPTTPSQPSQPTTPGQPSQPVPSQPSTPRQPTPVIPEVNPVHHPVASQLPQTGNSADWLSILGLGMASFLSMLGLSSLDRKH